MLGAGCPRTVPSYRNSLSKSMSRRVGSQEFCGPSSFSWGAEEFVLGHPHALLSPSVCMGMILRDKGPGPENTGHLPGLYRCGHGSLKEVLNRKMKRALDSGIRGKARAPRKGFHNELP